MTSCHKHTQKILCKHFGLLLYFSSSLYINLESALLNPHPEASVLGSDCSYLLLGAQREALKPLDIQVGVERGVPCPLQSKVPVPPPPLLLDGAQVGIDSKHPPLSAATETGGNVIWYEKHFRR